MNGAHTKRNITKRAYDPWHSHLA